MWGGGNTEKKQIKQRETEEKHTGDARNKKRNLRSDIFSHIVAICTYLTEKQFYRV